MKSLLPILRLAALLLLAGAAGCSRKEKVEDHLAKAGSYFGQCAELCGRNHANMYGRVTAVPFPQYQAWFDRQAADIKAARLEGARQRAALNKAQQDAAQQPQTP